MASMDNVGRNYRDFLGRLMKVDRAECAMGLRRQPIITTY